MKRALAERVKQEMGDPIVPPSAPPSYTLDCGGGGHPSKIPRPNTPPAAPVSASPRDISGDFAAMGERMTMEVHSSTTSAVISKKRPRSPVNTPNASGSGNEAAYRTSQKDDHGATPNGRGPGRPRKSTSSARQDQDSADEEEIENSSFYLKLQNASLASELYAYRRRIYLLERERELRRRECRIAGRKIGELSGVWRGLECAIGKELESNALLNPVRLFFPIRFILFLHHPHVAWTLIRELAFPLEYEGEPPIRGGLGRCSVVYRLRNGCGNYSFSLTFDSNFSFEYGENRKHRSSTEGSPIPCERPE